MAYQKIGERDIPLINRCIPAFSYYYPGYSIYPLCDCCESECAHPAYTKFWDLIQSEINNLVRFLNIVHSLNIESLDLFFSCTHSDLNILYSKLEECIDTGLVYKPVFLDGHYSFDLELPIEADYKQPWTSVREIYDVLELPFLFSNSCLTYRVLSEFLQVIYAALGVCVVKHPVSTKFDVIADPSEECSVCDGVYLKFSEDRVIITTIPYSINILPFHIVGVWEDVDFRRFDENQNYNCDSKTGLIMSSVVQSGNHYLKALYRNSPPINHFYDPVILGGHLFSFKYPSSSVSLSGDGPWVWSSLTKVHWYNWRTKCGISFDEVRLYFDEAKGKYMLAVNEDGRPIFGRDLEQVSISGVPGAGSSYTGLDTLLIFEEGFAATE